MCTCSDASGVCTLHKYILSTGKLHVTCHYDYIILTIMDISLHELLNMDMPPIQGVTKYRTHLLKMECMGGWVSPMFE